MKKFSKEHKEQIEPIKNEFINHVNLFMKERGIPLQVKGIALQPLADESCTKRCPRGQHCEWTVDTNTGELSMECVDDV